MESPQKMLHTVVSETTYVELDINKSYSTKPTNSTAHWAGCPLQI